MIINIGKETIALTHWLKEGDFWSSRHVVKNGHRAYDIFLSELYILVGFLMSLKHLIIISIWAG